MKVLLIAFVRNDEKVIETFVRHNLPFFDSALIVGHSSTDTTLEILRRLQSEFPCLRVETEMRSESDNLEALAYRYRRLVEEDAFDFMLRLDVDEFIEASHPVALKDCLLDTGTKYYFEISHTRMGTSDFMPGPTDGRLGRIAAIPNLRRFSRRLFFLDGGRDFMVPGHPFHFEIVPICVKKLNYLPQGDQDFIHPTSNTMRTVRAAKRPSPLESLFRQLMLLRPPELAAKLWHRLIPRRLREIANAISNYPEVRKGIGLARPYLYVPGAFANSSINSILYVSGKRHIQFSTIRYRCYNILDYLRASGWKGFLLLEEDIGLYERHILRSPPALCVVIRLEAEPRIKDFVSKLKKAGTRIVYDLDDLVFDVERDTSYAESSDRSVAELKRRKRFHRKGRRPIYIPLMKLADALTGTTSSLVEEERTIGDRCYKIPNSLNAFQEEFALASGSRNRDDLEVRIGYFSGSPTHNDDFMVVSEQLYDVLRRNGHVKFVLVGHLVLPDYFSLLGAGRILRYPVQDLRGYFELLATCDINIVPLVHRPANNCKSELKVFEAAALSIPSIASATRQHIECIDTWRNGVIAYSYADWSEALKRLIENPQLRREMGIAAKNTIAQKFSYKKVGKLAEKIYKTIISN